MNIGEKIKSRRKALNKTLEEVGKVVGVSKQTIQRYETGEIANIPYDKLVLLAKALECSGADFFFNESLSEKYDIENARLLNEIKNNAPVREFIKTFLKLSDANKKVVIAMVNTMYEANQNET